VKQAWYLVLAAAAGAGCIHTPLHSDTAKPPAKSATEAGRAPAPAAVTADQIDETNAHQKAQALADEMDRDRPNSKE
jgi:hypothetical protein